MTLGKIFKFVSRIGNPRRSLSNQTERRCCPILTLHTKKCCHSFKRKGQNGTESNGDKWYHLPPWCAGMMVVPKKEGSVRICVDLKPLDQSVLREMHPIPKVNDTRLEPQYLARLMPTVNFGKYPYQKNHAHLQPSSPHMVITTTISFLLEFPVSQTFRMNKILKGLK